VTLQARMTVTTAVACVLASTALLPLFSDTLWFIIAAGAVTAVAATGALTRLRTLPSAVCLAAGLASLLLYLNLIFETRHSWLLVIPTPASISRLWDLAGTGTHDANRYAPPVPNLPGLLLLAAGGVGITAVLADLIAVRLRSTALAGLPLLVLFSVPVMMNASHDEFVTGLVFCLAGSGYLAMLSADGRERIRVWGHLVSLWRGPPRYAGDERLGTPRRVRERGTGPDTRALAAAGRRVGLASIVLALCAPLLLPGLHPSKLFSSGPGIGGNGGGSSGVSLSLPSAVAQTVRQLQENHPVTVFTYTTSASAAEQANDAEYFRQYVFDTLGDAGWQVDDYAANAVQVSSMPGPQGLNDAAGEQTETTTVGVSPAFPGPGSQPTFLPLPYPAIQVEAPGKWLADSDLMVYSTSDSIAGQFYSVASVMVDPSPAQLAAVPGLVKTADLERDLQLPSSYRSAALRRLADSATAGQVTQFGKVDALATWLSGAQFGYSLNAAPLSSAADLLSFLTKAKSGFCVQYAYAMTVLTRLLGIPARFVVGYTSGTRLKDGSYVVKSTDAHAWTEVYFPGWGWIRFEPTPSGQGTANAPNYMTAGAGHGQLGTSPIISATQGPGSKKTPPQTNGLGRTHAVPGLGPVPGAVAGRAATPWTAIALAVIAAIVLTFTLISAIAPPARRATAGPPEPARRRRPPAATTALVLLATAALVALALYRLLARTAGLNLGTGWATVGLAFAATAAVALITPAVFRLARRRWRWLRAADDTTRAHAAWAEFHDDLADYGLTSRPSEPPRTLAARITTTLPEPAAAAVTRIALAEERASYAARPATSGHLRHDGTTARRGLAATARRTTRWRAAIFPASMMTTLTRTATRRDWRAGRLRGRHILRSPSCRRRHRSSIRSIIRARLVCPGRSACPLACALARAGRTLATCRRQLTSAHTRDSSMITAPAATRYTRWVTTPAASRPAPTTTPVRACASFRL
jgi:transglutaminase-like putative cysteine protease